MMQVPVAQATFVVADTQGSSDRTEMELRMRRFVQNVWELANDEGFVNLETTCEHVDLMPAENFH